MRKLSIIIVTIMLGLMVAPLAALAEAPVERPNPAKPFDAGDTSALETSDGASLSGLSLLAIGGGGALQAGADRLVEMQAWDGGWGWPLDPPTQPTPSPRNTIGPIGMGLAQAYAYTGDADHLAALEKVGAFLLAKTNNFSPPDGYLAAQLDAVFGGTTYRDHVMNNFYGPLANGIYNRNGAGTLYSTATYIDLIDTSRASQGIANLAAWDIGMGLVGAKAAGVTGADLDAWIQGTKDEIEQIVLGGDYDVLGLAGALYGLAYAGATFDPSAGDFADAGSLADLADILAGYQLDTGGFTWSSAALDGGNETIQETAYAVLALNQVDRAKYLEHIRKAAAYMVSVQLPEGGWKNDVESTSENNEVTAEALWGLAVAQPILWVDAPDHTDAEGKADVRVMLDPIIDVFGFEFTLTYDPSALSVVSVDPGGDLPGNQGEAGGYSWNVDITESGKIKVWVSLLDNGSPGDLPGLTAQSELVKVSFTASAGGTCATVNSLQLLDEILTRKEDGARIHPVTTMGDSITVYKLVPVSGVVQLQGRANGKWDGATISLTGGPFDYTGIQTAADGTWSANVACGTYRVYVDMNAYLDAQRDGATIHETYNAGSVKLLGGNADENTPNIIFLEDVVAIANVIGVTPAPDQSVANKYPDINADGTINILDLVLAGINYTETGPKTF